MARITVSAATVQRRELKGADPTGETFVMIRPPGMTECQQRAGLLSRHFSYWNTQGNLVQGTDCNAVDLAKHEIWWTHDDTNLEVDIESDNGEIETVTFKSKRDTSYSEFMESLNKLGTPSAIHIFNEWHSMVLGVVPAWRNPF